MEVSTNRDLDISQSPDIKISRTDGDLLKELGKAASEGEEHTQRTLLEQYQAYGWVFFLFCSAVQNSFNNIKMCS